VPETLFYSSFSILITSLITLLLLLCFTLRLNNPLLPIIGFTQEITKNRLLLFHFLGAVSLLLINKLELLLKPFLFPGIDFTPTIKQWEGGWTPWVQQTLEHPVLTFATTYVYVIFFSVLLFASLLIYHYEGDRRSLYGLLYAIGLNYFLAVPFFMLIAVDESWVLHPDIRFLIPEVYPMFEEQYRHFSGLDNSFPSLHTSISVTMAALAWRSRNRRFALICTASAGIVLFGILYLGIHWVIDLLAGLIHAWVCLRLADRFSERPLGSDWLFEPERKAQESLPPLS
jgi:membrane-associated phospholipid phosphatase